MQTDLNSLQNPVVSLAGTYFKFPSQNKYHPTWDYDNFSSLSPKFSIALSLVYFTPL